MLDTSLHFHGGKGLVAKMGEQICYDDYEYVRPMFKIKSDGQHIK